MKIFIRNLPTGTSPSSLQEFAQTALTPAWYQPLHKKIPIKDCQVLQIKDLDLKTTEFHGLLEISPYKIAIEAIARINGRSFKGRSLEARKWRERYDQHNQLEPNEISGSAKDNKWHGGNRRRPHLWIHTYEPPSFQGMKDFHRELI